MIPIYRSDPIVVLTALNFECQAVRNHLSDLTTRQHPAGTMFEVGMLAGSPRPIAVATLGPGNQAAAVLTERAVNLFQPAGLLFVGVAGAVKGGIALGDVVVGTRVYAIHGGRDERGRFLARPRCWEASHKLEQVARHVVRAGGWTVPIVGSGAVEPPAVHFGPIAAGEVVLDSRRSALARQLHRHYNDAVAIEMESAGFAAAGHLNGSIAILTIRGISDTADGTKHRADRIGWQPVAAAHAAAFAMELVRRLPQVSNRRGATLDSQT